MTEQKKLTGKCKFFDRKKGWGFITGSNGKEVFVHQTDILVVLTPDGMKPVL